MGYLMKYPIPTVLWDDIDIRPRGGAYHPNQKIWDYARTKWQTKSITASALPK